MPLQVALQKAIANGHVLDDLLMADKDFENSIQFAIYKRSFQWSLFY